MSGKTDKELTRFHNEEIDGLLKAASQKQPPTFLQVRSAMKPLGFNVGPRAYFKALGDDLVLEVSFDESGMMQSNITGCRTTPCRNDQLKSD